MLNRNFYLRDVHTVARELIGKRLVSVTGGERVSGMIVETEAYGGVTDKAAHSYGGRRTPRTETMYRIGGTAYIYLIYGLHSCLNIITGEEGNPQGVLIRAAEPLEGVEIMKKRRRSDNFRNLCSGPGKLCEAFGIDCSHKNSDICEGPIFVEEQLPFSQCEIIETTRVGIDYAGEARDYLWRYLLRGSSFISRGAAKSAP